MFATEHQIAIGDGRIFAKTWTPASVCEAASVLLFHDSLGCVELWRDFPEKLAEATQRRVVAYDRLGFGQSSRRTDRLTRAFISDEARKTVPALCQTLDLAKLVLFGHSVGGGMAVTTAAELPEICEAVITEGAQSFIEERTAEAIRAAEIQFMDPLQFERLERYHGEKARWVLDAWIGTWLRDEFAGWSLDAELAKVTCPLLALHSEDDEFGTIAQAQRIVRLARGGARLVAETTGGHLLHRSKQELVVGEVAAFLKSLE